MSSLAFGAAAEDAVETIFVVAPKSEPFGGISETHHSLGAEDIALNGSVTASDFIRRLPSAYASVNSRGESILTLRSAAERQVAVFFDGALLNVPWDNRYNLDLVPAHAVARAVTATGPVSPQYGVNALSAIALYPKTPDTNESGWRLSGEGGSGGYVATNGAVYGGFGSTSAFLSLGASQRNGWPIADLSRLQFNQANDRLRLNTDANHISGLLRFAHQTGAATYSASLLATDSSYGVAPEGDRDTGARFWRVPENRMVLGVARTNYDDVAGGALTASFWVQDVRQTIDRYEDASFLDVVESEMSRDRTYGARAIWTTQFLETRMTASANGFASYHREGSALFAPGADAFEAPDIYSNLSGSLGLDLERMVGDRATVEIGVGVDGVDYLKTAGRPASQPYLRPVYRAGVAWRFDETIRMRAALGRKSRMPTMRELYGAALNRFIPNPDLEAERSTTGEIGFEFARRNIVISATAFGQVLDNAVDQEIIDNRRRRINLAGSNVIGLELAGEAALTERLSVRGGMTAARIRRRDVAPGETDRLAERPGVIANLSTDYRFENGVRFTGEVTYTGRAYSPNSDGEFRPLPKTARFDLGAELPIYSINGRNRIVLYILGANIANSDIVPQAGLPAAGRIIKVGFRKTVR